MGYDYSFINLVGVLGAFLICGAYFAVSVRWLAPEGLRYQGANALGSAMLLASLAFRPNPGAIVIEAIWLAIALFAIGRCLTSRQR